MSDTWPALALISPWQGFDAMDVAGGDCGGGKR